MKKLNKLFVGIGLALASAAVYASCITTTVIQKDGSVTICTTCCYNGNCTTTCF